MALLFRPLQIGVPYMQRTTGNLMFHTVNTTYTYDDLTFIDNLEGILSEWSFRNQHNPQWLDYYAYPKVLTVLTYSQQGTIIYSRQLKQAVVTVKTDPDYIDKWYGATDFANRGVITWGSTLFGPHLPPTWINYPFCQIVAPRGESFNQIFYHLKPLVTVEIEVYELMQNPFPGSDLIPIYYNIGAGTFAYPEPDAS